MTDEPGHLLLQRTLVIPEGAWGMLVWQGRPLTLTLERTYDEGPRGTQMVKIPPGDYTLRRSWYNRGGYNTWQIVGGIVTPERRILIHKGNWEEHSEGCVLVGMGLLSTGPRPGIGYSAEAHQRLMTATAGADTLRLTVIHP